MNLVQKVRIFVPIVYIFGKFTKIAYSSRKIAGREKCRGKGGGTQISDLGWGKIKGGETRFSKNPRGELTPSHTMCKVLVRKRAFFSCCSYLLKTNISQKVPSI